MAEGQSSTHTWPKLLWVCDNCGHWHGASYATWTPDAPPTCKIKGYGRDGKSACGRVMRPVYVDCDGRVYPRASLPEVRDAARQILDDNPHGPWSLTVFEDAAAALTVDALDVRAAVGDLLAEKASWADAWAEFDRLDAARSAADAADPAAAQARVAAELERQLADLDTPRGGDGSDG